MVGGAALIHPVHTGQHFCASVVASKVRAGSGSCRTCRMARWFRQSAPAIADGGRRRFHSRPAWLPACPIQPVYAPRPARTRTTSAATAPCPTGHNTASWRPAGYRGRRGRILDKTFRAARQSRWATKRTSGLSMPMPNATVATITTPSSRKNAAGGWRARRRAGRRDRQGGDALLHQPGGGVFHSLARQAIDNAGLAGMMLLDITDQLLLGLMFSTTV